MRDHDRVRVGVQRGDEDVACSETGGVVRAAGDLGLAGHAVSRVEEDDHDALGDLAADGARATAAARSAVTTVSQTGAGASAMPSES